jgi:hypothetical protein
MTTMPSHIDDDTFLKAILDAPVKVGHHMTQFQFVIADGISRRAPWLTAVELVRDTNAMVRVVLEHAMKIKEGQ